MTDKHTPEIDFLLEEVVHRLGGPVATSKDFENLSQNIAEAIGQQISASTLKRLWGYMTLKPKPRISTLDILAQYTGRTSFRALCVELQRNSDFYGAQVVYSKGLAEGDVVLLKWMPDRTVRLEYLGAMKFLVQDPGTSKLRQGDLCEIKEFIKGLPLYIPGIVRDGKVMPEYVAGKQAGLTEIEVL